MRTFPLTLRLSLLTLLAAPALAQTQGSLRFAPVLYRVDAVSATLPSPGLVSHPTGIATDALGNLYVADTNHDVIRRVDPTGVATIIAGSGFYGATGDGGPGAQASLASPTQIAADPAGNVYVVSLSGIRKISAATGIITTIAGGNGAGSSGDGGPALAAVMQPASLACDALGNVFLLDTGNPNSYTIRKIDIFGNISTIAGGGTPSSGNGDGGPALQASLVSPNAIAVDTTGRVFIIDGPTVRVVTADDNISTYAGTTYGSSGDGGLATAAQFGALTGVAVDAAGYVYLSDFTYKNVRIINPITHIISLLAGKNPGSTPLDGTLADYVDISYPTSTGPSSVAVDTAGNVYFAVSNSNVIFQVVQHPERFPQTKLGNTTPTQRLLVENTSTNTITLNTVTIAGDYSLGSSGPYASTAGTTCAANLPIGPSGFPYCQFDIQFKPTAEGIRSFPLTITSNDTPGTLTQTLTSTALGSALAINSGQMVIVAGNYNATYGDLAFNVPATSAYLSDIAGMVVDSSNNIYLADYTFCQIRKVDGATGVFTNFAGATNANCDNDFFSAGTDANSALLLGPKRLALDSANNLYLADPFDSRIRRVLASNHTMDSFAGIGDTHFPNTACGYSGDNGPAASAALCYPLGMVFDTKGNMYFADSGNNVVRRIDTNGTITTIAGNQAMGQGYSGDGGPATSAQLFTPMDVAITSAGDLLILDTYNNVIRKVTMSTGVISTFAGRQTTAGGWGGDGDLATSATFNYPTSMALDAAGNLFVTDRDNYVVRKIDTSGTINTVAGIHQPGGAGYNGDDLLATDTGLDFPDLVSVSASGHIFVSDSSNRVIRELTPNGSLTFPLTKVGDTSSNMPITLSNVGNMPMHFDSSSPTGISGDFSLANTGTCNFSTPLAVGASCTVQLTFSPTAEGERFGVFAFYDDGVATPQYVSLGGTGLVQKSQTITFPAISDTPYTTTPITLFATSTSGQPITFGIVSGNATLTNANSLTLTGVGPVTVAASQSGGTYFLPATTVNRTFNVTQAPQTITSFDSIGDQVLGVGALKLNAVSDAGLPITFSVISGPASITGSVLTLTGTGLVTIAADQPGSTLYLPATQVTQSFQVRVQSVITWNPTTSIVYTGNPVGTGILNATVDQPGTLYYSYSNGIPAGLYPTSILPAGTYRVSLIFTPTDSTTVLGSSAIFTFTVQNQSIFFVDASGSASSFDNTGAAQSFGSSGGGKGAAVDATGKVWSIDASGSGLTSFTDTGAVATNVAGNGITGATAFSIDGSGTMWITNADGSIATAPTQGGGVHSGIRPAITRANVSPITAGGNISGATSIAVDSAGSLWITSAGDNSITEVLGVAAPVTTPLVTAVTNNSLAARP